MKLCLILVVVAGFATACARTEQQQATDTQQPASAQPASDHRRPHRQRPRHRRRHHPNAPRHRRRQNQPRLRPRSSATSRFRLARNSA